MIIHNPHNPLAEVFGYPISNQTLEAVTQRDNKFCPYHNIVPRCTKVDKINPLGVCSIYHKNEPVITCPVRFRQNWTVIADAARFFFGEDALYTPMPEIRLSDKRGRKAGNIDYVLVKHDDRGRITDFASLEVQAVYISGTIRGAFKTYIEEPTPDFTWNKTSKYPRPDYLSSSNKRLIPQMLIKGGIFNKWGKKQAVAVQTTFFHTLPPLEEVDEIEADLAWLLYDLIPSNDGQQYVLTKNKVVYTKFNEVLREFIDPQAGDVNRFVEQLQKAVYDKLNGKNNRIIDDPLDEDGDDDAI